MEEPKIAKGSLSLEDRGGALLGALVMVLDSKGSVDVAVGVNPEPKGSEDELKGSAPPEASSQYQNTTSQRQVIEQGWVLCTNMYISTLKCK